MDTIGNTCYCYNEECNQKEWEAMGYEGKYKWTVVQSIHISKKLLPQSKIPRCPHCGKRMVITSNMEVES